jgi:hypothetical protein
MGRNKRIPATIGHGVTPALQAHSKFLGLLVAVCWLIGPPAAVAENAKLTSRTAKCQADCRSGNTHGRYRAYSTSDPNLISPEGRKMYAECVRLCLAPLPTVYFQKSALEYHGEWFGSRMSDCLTCHARGENRNRATGVIMQPDALRRGP